MQFLTVLLYILLAITSLFLICLVLIQRGKGGGLAGAFGGAGGSSAFGTKAGDVFTRVTMITAGVWIALNMLLVVLSNQPDLGLGDVDPSARSRDLDAGQGDRPRRRGKPARRRRPGLPPGPRRRRTSLGPPPGDRPTRRPRLPLRRRPPPAPRAQAGSDRR